jgi:pimeloyl-ACP methyl ester carboxylesterase
MCARERRDGSRRRGPQGEGMHARTLLERAVFGALVALLTASSGCDHVRSARAPMSALAVTHRDQPDCLVILVPGMGDSPRRFLEHDFVEEARARGLRCDFVLPDAHLTYYREQNVGERLAADVLVEARARGYRRTWLVGVSLGAIGVLEAARRRPDLVDGLVLIAPFLGPEDRVLEALDGHPREPARRHLFVHVGPRTRWLTEAARSDRVPILVGFGASDRYAREHQRLARLLDPSRVVSAPGRHDWRTWRAVWSELADRMAALEPRGA